MDLSSFDVGDLEARARQQPVSLIDVVVHQIKRSFLLSVILGLANYDVGSASQLHDGESFPDDNRTDPDGFKPPRGRFDVSGLHLSVPESRERTGIGRSHGLSITAPERTEGGMDQKRNEIPRGK